MDTYTSNISSDLFPPEVIRSFREKMVVMQILDYKT